MRLQVYLGSQDEYDAAVDLYQEESSLREYYTRILSEARDSDSIDLKSIPLQRKPSEAFRLMGLIEDAIVAYLRDHNRPQTVRIVCTDEDIARMYKVVYNFRYADSKANRMDDDHWD